MQSIIINIKYIDRNAPGGKEHVGYIVVKIISVIRQIDYAIGFVITEKIAIVAAKEGDIDNITKDIPSILLIEVRSRYVLESIVLSETYNINSIMLIGEYIVDGRLDIWLPCKSILPSSLF